MSDLNEMGPGNLGAAAPDAAGHGVVGAMPAPSARTRVVRAFAPGRTEIAGNHVDHEGGLVIAGAVANGVSVTAWPSDAGEDNVVRIRSKGFEPIEVDLAQPDALLPHEGELGASVALVRGMLSQAKDAGVRLAGFEAEVMSAIPAGSGLSSSAAFELAVGQVVNTMFAGERMGAVELAHMGQRAEREWFGKPCGLMDQLAIAVGGIVAMDFRDPASPVVTPLTCDIEASGYAMCLVDVGSDHADLTDEYAAVPAEMQAVARYLGADRLADVSEYDLLMDVAGIREELGDRALLRALHFFGEQRLTQERVVALQAGDMERFIRATRRSAASSAQFLQNVSVGGDARNQPAMVALALAERLLDGEGACRIHGGGFGGSIQAYVPIRRLTTFTLGMDSYLEPGCCRYVQIGGPGAWARWE